MARPECIAIPKTQKYSFAVGSEHGPRSFRWNVVANGRDVQIDADRFCKHWHVSLHQSGQWHVKKVRSDPGKPKTHVLPHKNKVPAGQHPVELFILIPDSCLRKASQPEKLPKPDVWLDRPPHDGLVEVVVTTWEYSGERFGVAPLEEWPGQHFGTQLRVAFAIDNGPGLPTLGIITRHLPADHPVALAVERNRPRAPRIVLDSPERRGVLMGTADNASLSLMEYAID